MPERTLAPREIETDLPLALTPKEAAELLRVSVDQVREMCRQRSLPCMRVGGQWRVNRDAVLEELGYQVA